MGNRNIPWYMLEGPLAGINNSFNILGIRSKNCKVLLKGGKIKSAET